MAEPISIVDARHHLRGIPTKDEALVGSYVIAAREWVENHTGLILTRREVTESLNSFERTRLRAWPIATDQPVTVSYRDTAGVSQTIAGAVLRATSRPGLLYPPTGVRWPSCSSIAGAIDVTFTAGYASASEIPQVLKQAMLVLLTGFYEDREGGEMFARAEASAKSLCRRYKRRRL